jgi:hypothetical protein
MNWIASIFDLAMTVKRAFDTPSALLDEGRAFAERRYTNRQMFSEVMALLNE